MKTQRLYIFDLAFIPTRIPLSLFQKSRQPEKIISTETNLEKSATDFSHIRCPRCRWQPVPQARWVCADCGEPENFIGGCGTQWNTFTTHGICPGCGHQWKYTSCPRCRQWSPHEAWYAETTNQGGFQ